jgi:hypothetical protein
VILMPIRTNRGRAAVYRRLWGWPVRSPRHLGAAVFALAALAILIGLLVPRLASPLAALGPHQASPSVTATTGPPAAAAPGAAIGATTSTRRVPRATVTSPPTTAPAPEALAVAEAWARAWVNHPEGMTNDQWVAQLAPLTTDEFLPQLRSVDPANIPATTITGKAESVTASARAVDATITTDGPKLKLTVIATDAGWRVSAFDRAD